ncbi:murein hydrolase activator EnvC family protein [Candidatus Methylocalor cossyra]|uniref:Septal ring factor EnvC, activator of murein hydrolases AmiA and AmiB n=1 Tax=Candidatus Methylocalor cossyra TaxID=3108543 RepID=A0ABP1C6S1_9GAMM
MGRRLFWLAFALPALAGGAVPEAADQRLELNRIREAIEAVQKSRDTLESKKKALDEALREAESTYGRLLKTIRALEAEAEARTQHIAALRQQRHRLLVALRRERYVLSGQARAAYALGRTDWLKLLLNQQDPSRLARVLAYHRYLTQARSSLIQGMERKLAETRQLQDELSAESERLTGTRQQLLREQAAAEESRRARRQLLAELERELRDKNSELERLQEDERRLQDLVNSLRQPGPEGTPNEDSAPAPPAAVPGGPSPCPVAGRIVAEFGSPRMNGHWDGMLIAAPEGSPVRAVADGRVAFADWLRGYGLLIIVDHGNGIMSLYAFNQSLYKNVGDRVAAGEAIAAVGASGGRPEPGLYFGIRKQGQAVNPMPWCNHAH